ncbi:MAG: FAD:protein FMN transferase [Rikenellaceae bacterium]
MKIFRLLTLPLLAVVYSCAPSGTQNEYSTITGFAQGTTYCITYRDTTDFKGEIEELLTAFDNSLSLYNSESQLCKINSQKSDSVDMWIEESFLISQEVYNLSGGLFDPTVAPLIAAYGFARKEQRHELQDGELEDILQRVGLDKVSISEGRVYKEPTDVQLDFNGIAQGYSVDLVSRLIESHGISDYMVEIGGEVFSRGISPSNRKWRIGIDSPTNGNFISGAELANIVELEGRGLATSGNYRKFIDKPSGERITHTIDPRTGLSTQHNLLSATIIAESAGFADALATACMVGGYDWSVSFIEGLRDSLAIDCFLIYSDSEGNMQNYSTVELLKK